MQKRIVVLGGVGFIGTHLCLRLLEEGHEVFCVDIRDAVNSPLLRGVLQHPLRRREEDLKFFQKKVYWKDGKDRKS